MFDNKQIWESCLLEIKASVSRANFSTWFNNTSILREENGTVYIGVPNEFVRDWLFNRYTKMILKSLMNLIEGVRSVEYVIVKYNTKAQENKIENNNFKQSLPLDNLYINKEDGLNSKYIFENFVVGRFNELAYAATQGALGKLGTLYNPLFIYGPTGVGKTHLLQAMGNSVKTNYPDKKVYYTTFDKFGNDYVNSIQAGKNQIQTFKDNYRKYDVLIMDDIQFIGTRERTQEELFHLFNYYYDQNKQIIFSSDKHPNSIPNLEDRLRTRFQQGMVVDINEPDFESRLLLIKNKSKGIDLQLNADVMEMLANNIAGSIREIEGILNLILCQKQIKNNYNDVTFVGEIIKNSLKPKRGLQIKDIIKIICDYFNTDELMVLDKSRRKEYVRTRQIIMYILREDFSISYPHIGQKLGGKDHTTVIHSYEKIKSELKKDQSLVKELEEIRNLIKN